MDNATLSLVLEATDHAHRIELIIEQAKANAVTPQLQAAIEALTGKLRSTVQLHESVAAAGAAVAAAAASAPAAAAGSTTTAASVL